MTQPGELQAGSRGKTGLTHASFAAKEQDAHSFILTRAIFLLIFLPFPADLKSMFEWNDIYCTGVHSVDAQHRNLFSIAEELYTAMSTGQGKATVSRTLDRLVQYTASHFAHEERLMRLHDYPDLVPHKAEHDKLTAEVLRFQSDFRLGKVTMTVQLLHFLKDWLQHHIKVSDLKYAPFLVGHA
jgi:hemerythrin-like metal-binding protein